MFQHKYMMEDIEFPLESPPYGPGCDLFAEPHHPKASFRVQRRGTYLLSDLFCAAQAAEPGFVRMAPLATLCRDKQLFFTGERFDQWDLDILLYCAERTSVFNGRPELFRMVPAELLHTMGLRNTDANRERIFASLQRQQTGLITIRGRGYQYMTRLMDRVLVNAEDKLCLVEINGDVAATFRNNGLTETTRDRWALGRDGLVKWLYGATRIFTGGFASDVQSLQRFCRPGTDRESTFVRRLGRALDQLRAHGHIESWHLDGERIRVTTPEGQGGNTACGLLVPAS